MKKAGTLLDYLKIVRKSTPVYIAVDGIGEQVEALDDIVFNGSSLTLYPATGKEKGKSHSAR